MHVVHLGGRTKEKENKICGFEVSAIWKQQFKVEIQVVLLIFSIIESLT